MKAHFETVKICGLTVGAGPTLLFLYYDTHLTEDPKEPTPDPKNVNCDVCTNAKPALEVGAGMTVVGAVKVNVDMTSTSGHDGGIGVVLRISTCNIGPLRESGPVEVY